MRQKRRHKKLPQIGRVSRRLWVEMMARSVDSRRVPSGEPLPSDFANQSNRVSRLDTVGDEVLAVSLSGRNHRLSRARELERLEISWASGTAKRQSWVADITAVHATS